MPDYLSPAWMEAADRALAADPALAEATRDVHLVLQQTVDEADGAPPTSWHVRLEGGAARLVPGTAADATVTFTCDRQTATEIHAGGSSAQAAFMAGRLRVGGDVGALLAHQQLLAGLDDVLASLRTEA